MNVSSKSCSLPLAVVVILLARAGGVVLAQSDHTAGFTRYAQVQRSDGTYRAMLADRALLAALRSGAPPPEGATILMESYYRPGEIGSIFAKRLEGGRWLYASFQPGEPIPDFAPRPQCDLCHRAAEDRGGTFTLPLLARFAEEGELQRTLCPRSGRRPCRASVYGQPEDG